MNEQLDNADILELTVEIVTAHLSNNNLSTEEIPSLITSIHGTLATLASGRPNLGARTTEDPPVPIDETIHENYIICLEDGKELKMLKRHLRTHFNMTPEEYISKWNLPHDYPMVAPSYSEKRSRIARDTGLGLRQ